MFSTRDPSSLVPETLPVSRVRAFIPQEYDFSSGSGAFSSYTEVYSVLYDSGPDLRDIPRIAAIRRVNELGKRARKVIDCSFPRTRQPPLFPSLSMHSLALSE